MEIAYLAGGMPFREDVAQVFAMKINETNNETGELKPIDAIVTVKYDGTVTMFRHIESDFACNLESIIFAADKPYIDLRGFEIFNVETLEEFKQHVRDTEEYPGYLEPDEEDENY